MGFTRPWYSRALASLFVSALTASALVIGSSSTATADPAALLHVSGPLPTAQVDGVVWTQVVSDGVDFVGGSFDRSQPAGAAAGTAEEVRANLFAFDVATGDAVPFTATTNAQVRAIAASSDGSRIYIAGDFTEVNGRARSHIAALTRGGELVDGFAPVVNGKVLALTVRGDTVFLAGSFSAVAGHPRSRVAAVTTSGAVLAFAPKVADYAVRAVALSPDGTKLLLGGNFSTVNSKQWHGLAAVDSRTGQSRPWGASPAVANWGTNASIFSLSTRGQVVYATGYNYTAPGGTGSGDLEGAVAMNWSNGAIVWVEDCHGDSYSSFPFNDALYVASHAHNCANVVGGWSAPGSPSQWRRAQAFSQAPVGVLAHNTDRYHDWGGYPSPELVPGWSPVINAGSYTGLHQGAWSVTAGSGFLVFAGEFTQVDGVRQTGLVRFQGTPDAPDRVVAPPTGPIAHSTVPQRVGRPDAVPLGPTSIAVKWAAPKAAVADEVTSYVVNAYRRGALARTVVVDGSKRQAVITGLKRSTSYRIGVAARNGIGTGRQSLLDGARTKPNGANVSATERPSRVAKPSAHAGTVSVRVRWKAASTRGALRISRYQIRLVRAGAVVRTVTVGAAVRTRTVTRLTRGTGYATSVRARNWAGWGAWSTARSVHTR